MDVKAEAEKLIAQISKDGEIKEKFMKDPVGTASSLLGDVVDKETMDKIIAAAKSAIASGSLNDITDKLQNMFGDKLPGGLGGLFGGKKDEEKK